MRPTRKIVSVSALLILATSACQADRSDPRVRPAECADNMWYPSDPDALAKLVDGLIAKADPPPLSGKPGALISPHAGIRFSGPVAAAAYKTLEGHAYKRVIVLGFSHRHPFAGGAILSDVTAYGTPLGNIPLDRAACDRLLSTPEFEPHPQVHRREHSLEIQLPFLQRMLGEFLLVPVMIGQVDLAMYDRMTTAMAPLVDDDTLVVASTDFTHYGRRFMFVPFTEDVQANLKRIDESAAEQIIALDAQGFLRTLNENGVGSPSRRVPQTVCGRGPVTFLIALLNKAGKYKGRQLAYDTSGRMTNDWANSVSYMAIGFVKTGEKPRTASATPKRDATSLSAAERTTLLAIARDSAMAALTGKGRTNPGAAKYTLTDAMKAKGGAFVTLRNHGRLRGCIGTIIARGPLVDSVVENAVHAATRDWRFRANPVTAGEMKDITVEISVLSPPRLVDGPDKIELGKHGVILTRGTRRSVYLPQVATETGWDLETFLSHLSEKANLPADAWRRHGTRIEVFTAEVFGEPEADHAAKSK